MGLAKLIHAQKEHYSNAKGLALQFCYSRLGKKVFSKHLNWYKIGTID